MLCMIFVVILSVIVLRKSYSLVQYTAVLTVIGGLTIVTLADIYKSQDAKDESETGTIVLGMSLMVIA